MLIKLFAPFSYVVGSNEIKISISSETITLRELLKMLTAKWTKLSRYFGDLDQTQNISGRLTVIVDGNIINLEDLVYRDDNVQIFGPLSGG